MALEHAVLLEFADFASDGRFYTPSLKVKNNGRAISCFT
jgi:hypothetical protein